MEYSGVTFRQTHRFRALGLERLEAAVEAALPGGSGCDLDHAAT